MPADGVIGREQELAAVASLLDRTREGSAGLVLTGEAGVGKTTIWRAGIEGARERSFRVLSASPVAAETTMSFAATCDLLAGVVGEVLPRLPAPQRRALEVALLLVEPEGPAPDQRVVAAAFFNLLCALGASDPVLVAVDAVRRRCLCDVWPRSGLSRPRPQTESTLVALDGSGSVPGPERSPRARRTAAQHRGLELDDGQLETAAQNYAESLSIARTGVVGHGQWITTYCLAGLAAVAAARGDASRAGLLWGVVERLEEERGSKLTYFWRERYDRFIAAVAGSTTFDNATSASRELSLEQAVDYAARPSEQ
jgi:hypothetical protein